MPNSLFYLILKIILGGGCFYALDMLNTFPKLTRSHMVELEFKA